ncbi:hypothetical protein [Microlunatus speluncae]|uniref:hypothetical protein n=1 Tax=Microlunatus speluncae TaxID=2594267 RepID=UPI0012667E75|nr:hypothetical protein [Microlunatus speluncae]
MTEPPAEQRRVRVWFGPHLLRDYRAEVTAAEGYAQAIARRFGGLKVTVDAEVTDDLDPLPCEQLWTVVTP